MTRNLPKDLPSVYQAGRRAGLDDGHATTTTCDTYDARSNPWLVATGKPRPRPGALEQATAWADGYWGGWVDALDGTA